MNQFSDVSDKLTEVIESPPTKRQRKRAKANGNGGATGGGILIDPDLAAMNDKFAVVKIGGKTRVVTLEASPAYPGSLVPVFSTIPDFCAFHAKKKKYIAAQNGSTKRIGIGKWWIDHEERRQFDAIVYAPNVVENGKLNLWTGFGCEARAGDCNFRPPDIA